MKRIRILAISGSLRTRSSNTELLRAAALIASARADFTFYRGLDSLPHFNPDLDAEGAVLPPAVEELRNTIGESDALLISSPEYAHGVPGSLKNALDWLVSGPEMVGKPTGLLNASSRSFYAHVSLEETLKTMSAHMVHDAIATVPIDRRHVPASAIAIDSRFADTLKHATDALIAECVKRSSVLHDASRMSVA